MGNQVAAHLQTITSDVEIVDIHKLAAENVAKGDSQALRMYRARS